jgi:uncharacterized phage-associated protein
MTVSAHDVAQVLREHLGANVGDVRVHKLLYYCQGWHLARRGAPLFDEELEAWKEGPVVAKVWRDEKYSRPMPAPQSLSAEQLETVDLVIARYGRFTGGALSQMAHTEDPWLTASDRVGSADQTIDPKVVHEFFSRLAEREQHAFRPTPVTEGREAIINAARSLAR